MKYNENNFVNGFENSQFMLCFKVWLLTLNLLTTTIVAPPSNVNKWQMGFNSAFKGLNFRCCVYLKIGFEASGSILSFKN